jgi:hypothetical protein
MKLIDRLKSEIRAKINPDDMRLIWIDIFDKFDVFEWLNKDVGPEEVPLEVSIVIYGLITNKNLNFSEYLKMFNK